MTSRKDLQDSTTYKLQVTLSTLSALSCKSQQWQCFPSGFIFRGHMSPCFGKMGDTWMILGDKIFSKSCT